MKINKIIKTTMIGIGALTPIVATSVSVVSCGKKKTPPTPAKNPSFDDFLAKAGAETLINIIKNAKNTPAEWSSQTEFSKVSTSQSPSQKTFTIKIRSNKFDNTATFVATYIKDTAYDVSKDWVCSGQPEITFKDFADKATHETAVNIVANAKPAAGDWKSLPVGDVVLVNTVPNEQSGLVITTLKSTSENKTAVFKATYTAGLAYDVTKDWVCTVQPAIAVDFKTFKANAEKATFGDIKNANPSGIAIDLKDFESTFNITSKFSDDAKSKVTLTLTLTSKLAVTDYNRDKTLALSIPFNGVTYDVKNWVSPQYAVADFKQDLTTSVNTDAWKKWAITTINAKFSGTNWAASDTITNVINQAKADQNGTPFHVIMTNTTHSNMKEDVMIYFMKINSKAEMYQALPVSAWNWSKPTVDNWDKYSSSVTAWSKGQDVGFTVADFLKLDVTQTQHSFPIYWKRYLNNPGNIYNQVTWTVSNFKTDNSKQQFTCQIGFLDGDTPTDHTYKLNMTIGWDKTSAVFNKASASAGKNFISNSSDVINYDWFSETSKSLNGTISDQNKLDLYNSIADSVGANPNVDQKVTDFIKTHTASKDLTFNKINIGAKFDPITSSKVDGDFVQEFTMTISATDGTSVNGTFYIVRSSWVDRSTPFKHCVIKNTYNL